MIKFNLAGILFPRRCPVCHEVVEESGQLACDICRTRLTYVREPSCRRCGKPLLSEEQEYCMDCRRKRHVYDRGRAPLVYDRIMRESIAHFKYQGRREYAAFYSEEILKKCGREIVQWNAEVLVPIPLHPKRRRKRGYNQAALLARKISAGTGIPVDEKLLVRVKNTKAQKELDDRERFDNLKNAFAVRGGTMPYRRVILIDDIYTTGSTMDEAARILKENGVLTVFFLCISVGRGC